MNKKVSVVVTCYNHEKYIEECLRSIFAQTHQNIELIIFNDGSTDLSDEVISSTLLDSPFVETSYFSGTKYIEAARKIIMVNENIKKELQDIV